MKKMGFTRENRYEKARKIKRVLERFRKIDNQKILDFGCGNGYIGHFFSGGNSVSYADVKNKMAFCHNNFIKITNNFVQTKQKFDIIISNHVIEHVPNQEEHLNEIFRLLKKGGVCYLAFPNHIFPLENHTKIPLIHYFMNNEKYIRFCKRIGRYDECYLNYSYRPKILGMIKKLKFKKIYDSTSMYINLNTNLSILKLNFHMFSFLSPVNVFILKK
jgi:2-polyprenyl-3-methyl-5-hydroxy-6-metoxy-1,4-benzoquinol methylase